MPESSETEKQVGNQDEHPLMKEKEPSPYKADKQSNLLDLFSETPQKDFLASESLLDTSATKRPDIVKDLLAEPKDLLAPSKDLLETSEPLYDT